MTDTSQRETIENGRSLEIYEGYCPDPYCFERTIVERLNDEYYTFTTCRYCGQTYFASKLANLKKVDQYRNDTIDQLQRMNATPRRDCNEWVRIFGLSPFHCKLISPLLTKFAPGKFRDEPVTTKQISDKYSFDCKLLSDLAFSIDEFHLYSKGYGKDTSVADFYLADTLSLIAAQNNDQELLIPLYVGGDGSCLVHAISRALVGREIYWHALRQNIRRSLVDNELWYKKTLGEFVANDDWAEIIKECDANYLPRDVELGLGLRTVHIFAIANVLCRPIILLDIPENMKIGADFSAIFLPILRSIDECKDESGKLNSPLVVAWANKCHSHFVPLVTIKGRPKPKFYRSVLPKAWCVDDTEVTKYISFDNDYCIVADGKLTETEDMQELIKSVNQAFYRTQKLDPSVFCDYSEYVLQRNCYIPSEIETDIARCSLASFDGRLYRCLICWGLVEIFLFADDFEENGTLFQDLLKQEKTLNDRQIYVYKVKVKYDLANKRFEAVDVIFCLRCHYAEGQMRLQSLDGRILYKDGDHTRTPAPLAFCTRKMKHIWQNVEYDSPPMILNVEINKGTETWLERIYWFSFESDKSRNSVLRRTVEEIVSKHIKNAEEQESTVVSICESIKSSLNSISCDPKTLCCDPLWNLGKFPMKPINYESMNSEKFDSLCEVFYTPECDLISSTESTELSSSSEQSYTDQELTSSTKSQSKNDKVLSVPVVLENERKGSILWFSDITYDGILRQVCEVFKLNENQVEKLVCLNSITGEIDENFPFHLDANCEIKIYIRH